MLFVCPPTGSYRWFYFFQCTVEAEVSHEAHLPPVRDVLRYQGVLQVGFIVSWEPRDAIAVKRASRRFKANLCPKLFKARTKASSELKPS